MVPLFACTDLSVPFHSPIGVTHSVVIMFDATGPNKLPGKANQLAISSSLVRRRCWGSQGPRQHWVEELPLVVFPLASRRVRPRLEPCRGASKLAVVVCG